MMESGCFEKNVFGVKFAFLSKLRGIFSRNFVLVGSSEVTHIALWF